MGSPLQGAGFGGPLERLREGARVDLPRLADEYAKVRDGCEASSESDGKLDRPDYFGSPRLKDSWVPLRDVVWGAVGETGDNVWALAQGLEATVEGYIAADSGAAAEMNKIRGQLQGDHSTGNDEWKAGYENGQYPKQ